jgi:hypothetical protein
MHPATLKPLTAKRVTELTPERLPSRLRGGTLTTHHQKCKQSIVRQQQSIIITAQDKSLKNMRNSNNLAVWKFCHAKSQKLDIRYPNFVIKLVFLAL